MSLIILADEKKYSAKLINTKALNVLYVVFTDKYDDQRTHKQIMESLALLVARAISHYSLHAIVDVQFYANFVDPKYKDSGLVRIEDVTSYTESFNDLIKNALKLENKEYDEYIHLQV